MSLRKTFIYNLYMRTHNTKKVYQITGVRSLVQLYRFLGISEPPKRDDEQLRYSASNPRDILTGNELTKKTREHTNNVLDGIEDALTNDSASYSYCQEALKMLSAIENALSIFEDVSSDSTVADHLHRKSGDAGKNS
jgi:hypothetical protein